MSEIFLGILSLWRRFKASKFVAAFCLITGASDLDSATIFDSFDCTKEAFL
tara:strand:- start:473 stop:625 length:153 start_codon:yes stop_codon:yes gene_type:complete